MVVYTEVSSPLECVDSVTGRMDASCAGVLLPAKALIESTTKCVLTARGQSYTRAAKVPALVNAAQEFLGLAPKSMSDEDRAPAGLAVAGHPHPQRHRA